jgi:hypothetical protein
MKRKALIAVVVACALCVSFAGLGIGSLLNTISLKYHIGPGSSTMNAVTLDMGYINESSSWGSDPTGNGSPIDTTETITIGVPANVTIAFDNVTALDPFIALNVLIQFDQSGSAIAEGTISEGISTSVISNVPSGLYEIFVGYTYTAGPNPANGTIQIDVSQ